MRSERTSRATPAALCDAQALQSGSSQAWHGFYSVNEALMEPSFSAAAKAIMRQRPIDLSDRDETRFEQTIRGAERELPIHVGCATAARLEWLSGRW